MKKASIIIFCIGLVFVSAQGQEICLKNAWRAFNQKNYDSAIIYASECITEFADRALEMQQEWMNQNGKCPPVGEVNDMMKNRIFNNGLLNDVASAYFIKAKSEEALYESGREEYLEILRITCQDAQAYSCGRCWDKRGWFWNPVKDCQRILAKISG